MSETEKKSKEETALLKESVKQFGINPEYYLVVQRKWSSEDWTEIRSKIVRRSTDGERFRSRLNIVIYAYFLQLVKKKKYPE